MSYGAHFCMLRLSRFWKHEPTNAKPFLGISSTRAWPSRFLVPHPYLPNLSSSPDYVSPIWALQSPAIHSSVYIRTIPIILANASLNSCLSASILPVCGPYTYITHTICFFIMAYAMLIRPFHLSTLTTSLLISFAITMPTPRRRPSPPACKHLRPPSIILAISPLHFVYWTHITSNLLLSIMSTTSTHFPIIVPTLRLELGQMVSISKYRDTTWYRYQTFKVSKYRLDSSIISLYLDIDTYFDI